MKAINIKWDTDGDKELFKSLPSEVELPEFNPEKFKDEDEYLDWVSNWLTDTYEFCHRGFDIIKNPKRTSTDKILMVKRIFEKKIQKTEQMIADCKNKCNELRAENRSPKILHTKYTQNAVKIGENMHRLDQLRPQIKAYREVLSIIDNIINNFEKEKTDE